MRSLPGDLAQQPAGGRDAVDDGGAGACERDDYAVVGQKVGQGMILRMGSSVAGWLGGRAQAARAIATGAKAARSKAAGSLSAAPAKCRLRQLPGVQILARAFARSASSARCLVAPAGRRSRPAGPAPAPGARGLAPTLRLAREGHLKLGERRRDLLADLGRQQRQQRPHGLDRDLRLVQVALRRRVLARRRGETEPARAEVDQRHRRLDDARPRRGCCAAAPRAPPASRPRSAVPAALPVRGSAPAGGCPLCSFMP